MSVVLNIFSEFDNSGVKKAQKEFSQLEGVGAKAGFALKKAFAPAVGVLGALGAGLFVATEAAIEDAAASNLLAIALNKTTKATKDELKANGEFIDSLMLATNTADDELRPAMARLSRSTKDVTKAQELLSLAVDISKGSGKSLETVTSALAKGYDGNTNALGKLGLGLDQSLIKSKDFGKITTELQKNFGGFGKAVGETTEGQLARFQLGMAELKESIGAALLPVIQALLPYLVKIGEWAQKNPQYIIAAGAALAAVAAAIVAINIAMIANPIGLITAGIVLLVAAVVGAYKKFDGFKAVVDNVFGAMKFWINNVTIPAIQTLYTVFKTVFNGIATLWNNSIGKLSFKAPSWVPGIGGKGFDVPNIPMLANGGIVNKATLAVIGESGPEAVVPLSRAGEFGMGGGNNVYLTVNALDPQTAAQSVVKALQSYNRSNGAVPVNVRAL